MKKFSAIVAVLLVVVMLAGSAFASGISVSGKYDGTYITWTVNGDFGFGYDVKVDGALELADWTLAKGQLKIALDTTVDHKVTVESDNGSDYFIIPAVKPTAKPTAVPTAEPTAVPTAEPTAVPTAEPTAVPTAEPTAVPTAEPTAVPTAEPTAVPTAEPTAVPTAKPTAVPTAEPTAEPTAVPTAEPTAAPTQAPVEDEVEDDDVPKTGDNSASYVIASVAMLLAAAYLVSRRFSRA